jgi:endonuclease/exonuclease/phosphatase family metal-dependent hydrolase
VERSAMDRLVTALQALGYPYDYKYLNVRGRQDLAILYDSQTSTVTLAQNIMNRHADAWQVETASGRSAFPRRPLIARVKIEPRVTGGSTTGRAVEFVMISTHLKAFGDPESRARRRLAAQILTEVIEDIRKTEKLPVVLGGDLNETLNTDVLSALTSASDLITLTSDDADDNALSYVGATHRSLIDHIVVSNDVRLLPISGDDAAIVRLDRSVSDFADDVSDHVPLVIRMVHRDSPLQIDPACPGESGLQTDVPEGAKSVTISFE